MTHALGALAFGLVVVVRALWDSPSFVVGLTLLFQGRWELTWLVLPVLAALIALDMHVTSAVANLSGLRRLRRELAVFRSDHAGLRLRARRVSEYVDAETLAKLGEESTLHVPDYVYEVVLAPGNDFTVIYLARQSFSCPGLVLISVTPAELDDWQRFIVYHELAHASMWGLGTRFFGDGVVPRTIALCILFGALWGTFSPALPAVFAIYGFARWRAEARDVSELDECRAHAVAVWALPDGTDFERIIASARLLGSFSKRQETSLRNAIAERLRRGRFVGDPELETSSSALWYLAVLPISMLSVASTGLTVGLLVLVGLIVAARSVMYLVASQNRRLIAGFVDDHLERDREGAARGPYPWTGNPWLDP